LTRPGFPTYYRITVPQYRFGENDLAAPTFDAL